MIVQPIAFCMDLICTAYHSMCLQNEFSYLKIGTNYMKDRSHQSYRSLVPLDDTHSPVLYCMSVCELTNFRVMFSLTDNDSPKEYCISSTVHDRLEENERWFSDILTLRFSVCMCIKIISFCKISGKFLISKTILCLTTSMTGVKRLFGKTGST